MATCQDDCAKSLSQTAKQWFSDLGSTNIWNLKYRHGFAFISVRGSSDACDEKMATNITDAV